MDKYLIGKNITEISIKLTLSIILIGQINLSMY